MPIEPPYHPAAQNAFRDGARVLLQKNTDFPAFAVAQNLFFDPRLALYHQREGWLAVADLHYGYELSLRRAGALFPNFGMAALEKRLGGLIADYCPRTLLLLGDHIHNGASAPAFLAWLEKLRMLVPTLILLLGNHDKALCKSNLDLPRQYSAGDFVFAHGHEEVETEAEQNLVIGHWHPGIAIHDSAGFRQKMPALGRRNRCWILPAFSVWAAGGRLPGDEPTDYWISTGSRCLPHPRSQQFCS